MIYPIIAYGDPILRKKAIDLSADYENLQQLINDMYETMRSSSGIGLAAPQIGKSIRLFIVDSKYVLDNYRDDEEYEFRNEAGITETFINAKIISKGGDKWNYNEGCLSIPKIREDVLREDEVVIEYYNAQFEKQEKIFDGLTGRVIQHEYDHLEGILFVDHLKPLKKRLLKKKLENISKGIVHVDYRMKFPLKK